MRIEKNEVPRSEECQIEALYGNGCALGAPPFSAVRRLTGKAGWDSAFDKPKTKEEVLAAAKPFLA